MNCTQYVHMHGYVLLRNQHSIHLKHVCIHSSLNHIANIAEAITYPHLVPGCGLSPFPLSPHSLD